MACGKRALLHYAKHGFRGLTGIASRRDAGQSRLIDRETGDWILDAIEKSPGIPFSVLYRTWDEHGRGLPSESTVRRFLESKGYDARTLKAGRLESGPQKAFEAPAPGDLWMVDFACGPTLRASNGKALSTHLCLWLDDHSRLIPYGADYAKANTAAFLDCLKQAVLRRGLPLKLYTDQSPHERFTASRHPIRQVEDPENIDPLFYTRTRRVVRKDGSVTLEKQLFEVDLSLRALKVELRYNPLTFDPVEVWRKDSFHDWPAGVTCTSIVRTSTKETTMPAETPGTRCGKSPAIEELLRAWGLRQCPFAPDDKSHALFDIAAHEAVLTHLDTAAALAPLPRESIEAYLNWHVARAGLQRDIFSSAAIALLAEASAGNARLLGLLAQNAWFAAARQGVFDIEPAHVHTALAQVPAAKMKITHR